MPASSDADQNSHAPWRPSTASNAAAQAEVQARRTIDQAPRTTNPENIQNEKVASLTDVHFLVTVRPTNHAAPCDQ